MHAYHDKRQALLIPYRIEHPRPVVNTHLPRTVHRDTDRAQRKGTSGPISIPFAAVFHYAKLCTADGRRKRIGINVTVN